jgi:hypothetical protein
LTASAVLAVADSKVNPGALGFIVVALLGVATWLLIRSMNKHLGRVQVPREGEPGSAGTDPQGPTEGGDGDVPPPAR